jgi:hypothetical protein
MSDATHCLRARAERGFFSLTGYSAIAIGQFHEQVHCQCGILLASHKQTGDIDNQFRSQKGQITRLRPRHMQRLVFQPAKWMRRRINRIAQPCFCLVFIASVGSYEGSASESLEEPNLCRAYCTVLTNLRHRTELPRVLRIHGRMMGRLRTGVCVVRRAGV